MLNETIHQHIAAGNQSTSALSDKLKALQPKKRTSNRAKFTEHYDDIIDAIGRGVSIKDIREALAADGLKLSSATFTRLLKVEKMRRTQIATIHEAAQPGQETIA